MSDHFRPRGILFDLWGTVAPDWSARRDEVSHQMADDLGVDGEAFAVAVRDSYSERFLGSLGDLEATVATLAKRCGASPGLAAVRTAAGRRLDLTARLLGSDPDTLAVLDELLERGFRLGLVTDSSVETSTLWPASPLARRFSATAFSCLAGVRKPEPALYGVALEGLGLSPAACAYVGDGGSNELSGAARLGMLTYRLRGDGDVGAERYDDDIDFAGPEIACLQELLALPWAMLRG